VASTFPYQILDETAHRPWPMPDLPWVMTQTWHDLLFAHWPIDPAVLADKVPAAFPIDLYDGQAWLGIVPFRITNLAPRGIPSIPFVSSFAELNVRTYVTVEGKPGVFFFSLDAGSSLAVAGARTFFHLPYFNAAMETDVVGEVVRYLSIRDAKSPAGRFQAIYQPVGPAHPPTPGTLEHFLTERYCLYTLDDQGRRRRLQIHHPPWPLQDAQAHIQANTMAEAAGITLPTIPPLLHFAKRQDMVGWGMEIV
jgi:uncharacterized protein